MDPGTHLIINAVNKHGINPPTVCSLNEAFIGELGPVSDLAVSLKANGDPWRWHRGQPRVRVNVKPQSKEPASWTHGRPSDHEGS